jgi:hypothetical protein
MEFIKLCYAVLIVGYLNELATLIQDQFIFENYIQWFSVKIINIFDKDREFKFKMMKMFGRFLIVAGVLELMQVTKFHRLILYRFSNSIKI